MRVLILGGSGMLGHKLWQACDARYETFVTFRKSAGDYARYGLFNPQRTMGRVSSNDFDSITRAVALARPEVIVNCIGIVKQDAAAKDPLSSIAVNALFPHRLAQLCVAAGIRLIHVSTDCVFSGRKGDYLESDAADACDLYGRTKFLGEVDYEGCLTIRTSMVGRELEGSHGLIEWFLDQEGKSIRGFRRAIFSGFTTGALSEIIVRIINEHADLRGVWHVAAEPISKFDLLSLVREVYKLNIAIEPDEEFVCDRSLNAERFRAATGFIPPPWPSMIDEMQREIIPYAEIRKLHADR
jgi:dTDP-4-dehydrorhamnose reductase